MVAWFWTWRHNGDHLNHHCLPESLNWPHTASTHYSSVKASSENPQKIFHSQRLELGPPLKHMVGWGISSRRSHECLQEKVSWGHTGRDTPRRYSRLAGCKNSHTCADKSASSPQGTAFGLTKVSITKRAPQKGRWNWKLQASRHVFNGVKSSHQKHPTHRTDFMPTHTQERPCHATVTVPWGLGVGSASQSRALRAGLGSPPLPAAGFSVARRGSAHTGTSAQLAEEDEALGLDRLLHPCLLVGKGHLSWISVAAQSKNLK